MFKLKFRLKKYFFKPYQKENKVILHIVKVLNKS